MISTSFKISRQKIPKFPRTLIYKFTSLSTIPPINNQLPRNSPPLLLQNHPENPINKAQNLLLNCTDLHHLHQLHAFIIRTHFLESSNHPVNWNNIIRSYVRLNSPCYALRIYMIMLKFRVSPDNYTLPIIIKAVGQVCRSLRIAQQFHCVVVKLGFENDEFVECGMINLYWKLGNFGNARKVFDESPETKLGSWNAMISGLGKYGRLWAVVHMFSRMRRGGVEPDGVTMVSVISACGGLGDLKLVQRLHKFVLQVKVRREEDVSMLNSVIDMYGKCGRMDLANRVFSGMLQRNVSSWTSMIVGYANHGHVKEALECFRAMVEANVEPNHVTFLGVLSACVHGGMVDEGKRWFEAMHRVYGVKPRIKHYGCMVDLLGRAGLLEEARDMVEKMPMKPNVVIYGCLLGACERYNKVEVGEWVSERFLELDPGNEGVYVVLSNIYANREMWDEVERVREVMKQRRLPKIQGYSSVATVN